MTRIKSPPSSLFFWNLCQILQSLAASLEQFVMKLLSKSRVVSQEVGAGAGSELLTNVHLLQREQMNWRK